MEGIQILNRIANYLFDEMCFYSLTEPITAQNYQRALELVEEIINENDGEGK
jgi:hypothetical protein